MNRNEEYAALLAELDNQPAALAGTVERAKERRRRELRLRRAIIAPFGSIAAFAIVFIVTVNTSLAFAMACGKIPLLRELAAAVAFSPSLSAAVENEYVQPIDLEQTVNGVTMRIEYVIVDQKQLNIFYTLRSAEYSHMDVTPSITGADGAPMEGFAIRTAAGGENGEIQHIGVDFMQNDVPSNIHLTCKINDNGSSEFAMPMPVADDISQSGEYIEPDWVAVFGFAIGFDPGFTQKGDVFDIGQAVAIGGQNFIITTVEVYPTHLRLNIDEDEDNSLRLQELDFYVENEKGKRFGAIRNGITATWSEGSSTMSSHRLESPYFSKSESLTLFITGATFSDKHLVLADLSKGTIHGALPEGVAFKGAERSGDGWTLAFVGRELERDGHFTMYQFIDSRVYDDNGNEYISGGGSSTYGYYDENGDYVEDKGGGAGIFTGKVYLTDYPFDTVWLRFMRSSEVALPTPIAVKVK